MNLWPFKLIFHPGRQRPAPEQLIVTLLGAFVLISPFFLRPDPRLLGTHTQLLLPPCIFYRLTSIPCATCGTTTSFTFLAHGNLMQSFLAHPLGWLAYLYLLALTLILGFAAVRRWRVNLEIKAGLTQVLVLIIVFWAAKLLAWYLPH